MAKDTAFWLSTDMINHENTQFSTRISLAKFKTIFTCMYDISVFKHTAVYRNKSK